MVLAGGAARGAYEAGVLRYLYDELPKHLGYAPWPDIVSGTSVGALNGAFVAGRDVEGLRWLSKRYQELEIPEIYGVSYLDALRTVRSAFGDQPFAFADPKPLQRMVIRQFPRAQVRRAVEQDGVTWIVGATDLRTGYQVLFVDAPQAPAWKPRPGSTLVHTPIRAIHCLASAALPLLFPPIQVGDRLLVDGGLRMNTPLRPVIRAGAERAIVISLKRQSQDLVREVQAPNLPFLVGKTLNALLLDPVEQDLWEAEQTNELIAWGRQRFGPEFADALLAERNLREVDILFLAPSEDIGQMAAEIYRANPPKVRGAVGALLHRAAGRTSPDADLLSYVYFDKAFTGALEALGYEDARRNGERILRLVAGPL